ncbi:hypothetical protein FACS1894204_12810 [Synergistales bacterium]|nr:hypothetical protein FACS1894204_12810 [Synergistales bacterium]
MYYKLVYYMYYMYYMYYKNIIVVQFVVHNSLDLDSLTFRILDLEN